MIFVIKEQELDQRFEAQAKATKVSEPFKPKYPPELNFEPDAQLIPYLANKTL